MNSWLKILYFWGVMVSLFLGITGCQEEGDSTPEAEKVAPQDLPPLTVTSQDLNTRTPTFKWQDIGQGVQYTLQLLRSDCEGLLGEYQKGTVVSHDFDALDPGSYCLKVQGNLQGGVSITSIPLNFLISGDIGDGLSSSHSLLTFGATPQDEPRAVKVTITNPSDQDFLQCGPIVLDNPIDFALGDNSCQDPKMAPGTSCEVEVRAISKDLVERRIGEISRHCALGGSFYTPALIPPIPQSEAP